MLLKSSGSLTDQFKSALLRIFEKSLRHYVAWFVFQIFRIRDHSESSIASKPKSYNHIAGRLGLRVNKKLAPAGASLCLLLHLDIDGACCWVEGDVAVLEVHALEAVNFKDGAGG
ncbi:hypothetical protein CIP107537_02209 [Corynebacterium diphtheriae]|nr:hypothetical protein CIP107537_02209 [Corynebacterium diphtheriae]